MKQIPLTRGLFALVDDEDFEWLNQWKWHTGIGGKTCYARTDKLRMHRLIMGCTKGDSRQVDHINGNGLDNRRENLRVCSCGQNLQNKPAIGIYQRGNKWHAKICVNYKQLFLGSFCTREEAKVAREAAQLRYFGEFTHKDSA